MHSMTSFCCLTRFSRLLVLIYESLFSSLLYSVSKIVLQLKSTFFEDHALIDFFKAIYGQGSVFLPGAYKFDL